MRVVNSQIHTSSTLPSTRMYVQKTQTHKPTHTHRSGTAPHLPPRPQSLLLLQHRSTAHRLRSPRTRWHPPPACWLTLDTRHGRSPADLSRTDGRTDGRHIPDPWRAGGDWSAPPTGRPAPGLSRPPRRPTHRSTHQT